MKPLIFAIETVLNAVQDIIDFTQINPSEKSFPSYHPLKLATNCDTFISVLTTFRYNV